MVAFKYYNGCMSEEKTEQKLTVRFLPSMLDELRSLAKEDKRSLNSEILWAIQFYLDWRRKQKTKKKDTL